MPDALDDARRLIQARLAEIDTEARQLGRAVASLGEGSGPSPRRRRSSKRDGAAASTSSQPKRRPRSCRAFKRAKRGQRKAELLAAIKKMSGANASEVADAIGIGPNQVRALIRKAEVEGMIEKRGQGFVLAKGRTSSAG